MFKFLNTQNKLYRLYIDQPIGAGFSYGTTTVKTSLEAAIAVYNALQLFYSEPTFKKFVGRDFALWTESYGGQSIPHLSLFGFKRSPPCLFANPPKRLERLWLCKKATTLRPWWTIFFNRIVTWVKPETL